MSLNLTIVMSKSWILFRAMNKKYMLKFRKKKQIQLYGET